MNNGADRPALGIGVGNMAVHGVGLRRPSFSYLRDYVRSLRELLSPSGETTWSGQRFETHWRPEGLPAVPISVASHGLAGIRTAASFADGIICGFGLLPENVEPALAAVDEGAGRAGRDPASIDIWWNAMVAFGTSRQEAFAEMSGAGGTEAEVEQALSALQARGVPNVMFLPMGGDKTAVAARVGLLAQRVRGQARGA